MIVLDASAAVELVLGTPAGHRVRRKLQASGPALHAPHLIDLEVASALRSFERSGAIRPAEAAGALALFGALDIDRCEHALLLPRIWQLRRNITVHDGAYIALAELLRATVVTCDGNLARAPGHSAAVELVA